MRGASVKRVFTGPQMRGVGWRRLMIRGGEGGAASPADRAASPAAP